MPTKTPATSPRRLALAAAIVAVVVAASLTGAFAFTDSGSQALGPTGGIGPTGPSIKNPLGYGERVSLAEATARLGRPIVLPDASPISPPHIGAVWVEKRFGPTQPISRVAAVTFPRQGVWVDYGTGHGGYRGGVWDDVLLEYEDFVHQVGSSQLIDLDGVPAVVFPRSSRGDLGTVRFDAGGVPVIVWGWHDPATLVAVARSIVDRSAEPPDGQLGRVDGIQLVSYQPPARQIDLADASATLGGRVVLPNTSLANASAAGPVWTEGSCPAPRGQLNFFHASPCWVWVSFPLTGISIGYLRPIFVIHKRPQREKHWAGLARKYGDNAKVVELGSVPALAIAPHDPYPGSVEFDLDGTRVVVAGNYDTATLQDVAQSIVDRSK